MGFSDIQKHMYINGLDLPAWPGLAWLGLGLALGLGLGLGLSGM